MEKDVVVSLPSYLWKGVYLAGINERMTLLKKAKGVEGLYGDVLRNDAQELSVALQEIELNLFMGQEDAID